MEHILASNLQESSANIFCVSYTDDRSAGGSSLNDMRLGIKNHVVGTNMPHLANAKAGDLAIVTAYSAGKRVFMMGVLGAAVPKCNVWQNEGGECWKFNFEYTPLTGEIALDDIKTAWTQICKDRAVNPHNMFNTRLCGYGKKYKDALAHAIDEGLIPLARVVHRA